MKKLNKTEVNALANKIRRDLKNLQFDLTTHEKEVLISQFKNIYFADVFQQL